MSISAGLVGLPNVGKSTLFNALTKSSVAAENYPFCTIDPHIACTPVPDDRLQKLKDSYKSEKIIPSTVQFVDIAGLVKGAASGEGLGNKFLSNIREVNLILHVLRCFADDNITHSSLSIDPLADFEIINTELMLKDLESVNKRIEKVNQLIKASKNDPKKTKELTEELSLLEKLKIALDSGNHDKLLEIAHNTTTPTIPLLSTKKFLIIANISEDDIQDNKYKQNPYYKRLLERFNENIIIPISAKLEYELSQLNEEEQKEMSSMMGLSKSSLENIIENTYQHLGLITFFTCGPKEIHAWPIIKGTPIRKAAGEIHSDLERGFICAEVFNANDLFNAGSIAKLKELGKVRTEGQDYTVQDGDIVLIRFNV